jgi:hypothetical protein
VRKFGLACVVVAAACSSKPTATLDVVTGGEADAFSKQPTPATIVVEEVGTDGVPKELSRSAYPADTLSLGDVGQNDVAAIRVTAIDGAGKPLLRGESLFVQFGALSDTTFEIYVQRTGELARLPRQPGVKLDAPMVDVLLGRYIVAASGTATMLYDLLFLQALTTLPTLPRNAASLATYGTVTLAIDENGASTLDLSDGTTAEQPSPVGGTWGEVAGGMTVHSSDGTSYVIGGTRTAHGGPSARVLKIGADGALSFASLITPRLGACATFVTGRGLVVYGGSATGAGAEVLAPGTAQAAALPYASDAVTSCGIATLDATHIVVAGGTRQGVPDAPPSAFDLGCAADCHPAVWHDVVALPRAQGDGLAGDAALFIGDDAAGNSHAFRCSPDACREIPLKVPRQGARVVPLPDGSTGMVGGVPEIETYRD